MHIHTILSILLSTGASDDFCKQGIYDIAGNVCEWTLEHATSNSSMPCAGRGGSYYDSGDFYPASDRSYDVTNSYCEFISFRLSLY